MKKHKRRIFKILIILLIIIIGIVFIIKLIENDVTKRENFKSNVVKNGSTNDNNIVNNAKNIEWDEITEEGVNEELLFQNINTKYLEKISTLLQSLSAEIAQKEKEDINFYLSAGWYKYTLDSQQFNEFINMGQDAIKPLYLIIYKSLD